MSRVPYEMPPQGGIQAPGGVATCVMLPFPSRAFINKISIIQTEGTVVDFTAALFNRDGACEGAAESESLVGGEDAPLPADLYRVTPDLVGAAGVLLYFSESSSTGGHGFVFFNQDNPLARGSNLGNPRFIYLRITPQGSGPKEFAVALGGEACM